MVNPIVSCCLSLAALVSGSAADENVRPRLVVLTDIGGDPDDQQSMIRLMVYSNEFEIEGLIASASGTRGELKEAVVKPRLIGQIVEAYGKVRDNLARHAEGYPTADYLRARIKSGNPQRGLDAIGDGHELTYRWWIYPEAGTYRGTPTLKNADSPQVVVSLPPNARGDLHLILEVTDNGQPPLTSFRRIRVEVD